MPDPAASDRLARAIDVHRLFLLGEGPRDPQALLAAHEELRDLLEPMLDDAELDLPDDDLGRIGSFRLLRELGRGGMGVVYEAEDEELGRHVAVKLLPDQGARDTRGVARFLREARLAAGLDHAGLVRVFGVEKHEGCYCIVMELVRGVSLQDALASLGRGRGKQVDAQHFLALVRATCAERFGAADADPAPDARAFVTLAAELMRQVAVALAHAHAAGVVHRDVKPGNILLTPDGRAVLGDFGVATAHDTVGMTRTGDFAGTPSYASPEQLRGESARADARSDVFSLGATLYELLAGERPFPGTSIVEVRTRIERDEPVPVARRNPAVSRDFAAIVGRCLEKRPEDRYAGAAELADDLARFLAGETVWARPVPWPQRTLRWAGRNRVVTALLGGLAGAAAVVTVLAVLAREAEIAKGVALTDFHRLKVRGDLISLEQAVDEPVPAWPNDAARLDDLGKRANDLVTARAGLNAALVRLRASARRLAPTERRRALVPHAEEARLARLVAEAKVLRNTANDARFRVAKGDAEHADAELADELEQRAQVLEPKIRELEARVTDRRLWAFADGQDEFLHDALEDIVASVDAFVDVRMSVLLQRQKHARLECAQLLAAHREPWAQAIAAAKAQGIELAPQHDLIPLGADKASGLLEFAHAPSGSPPARRDDGRLVMAADAGIVLVLVPGGKTTIGAQSDDPDAPYYHTRAQSMEGPVHEVELAPFLIGKHELTHAQWLALRASRPEVEDEALEMTCRRYWEAKPVVKVTWEMADRLLRAHGLALPTEVQWEHSARAGTTTPYYCGDQPGGLPRIANVAGQEQPGRIPDQGAFHDGVVGRALAFVVPKLEISVNKAFRPNAFGLHHMIGNVAEWCADLGVGYGQPATPGSGLREGGASSGDSRIVRGGSYMQGVDDARVSRRDTRSPRESFMVVGVRAARALRAD